VCALKDTCKGKLSHLSLYDIVTILLWDFHKCWHRVRRIKDSTTWVCFQVCVALRLFRLSAIMMYTSDSTCCTLTSLRFRPAIPVSIILTDIPEKNLHNNGPVTIPLINSVLGFSSTPSIYLYLLLPNNDVSRLPGIAYCMDINYKCFLT